VTLGADEKRLDGQAEQQQWPSWREDLATTWVLLDGRIGLGASKNCAIVLPDAGAEIAAEIWFHEGFRIAPCPGVSLTIADTEFTEEAPLPAGSDICIGETAFRVETVQSAALSGSANAPSASAKSR
jgi:hypothetical protein